MTLKQCVMQSDFGVAQKAMFNYDPWRAVFGSVS